MLIHGLSEFSKLEVASQEEVLRHSADNGTEASKPRGKADALLKGSVTQRGDTYVVDVDLTSSDGSQELLGWNRTIKSSEIGRFELEMPKRIAQEVGVKLTGELKHLANGPYYEGDEAYREY